MLGKMFIHGLLAAMLVAGAAGTFAASAGENPLVLLEDR
jgi:hypothetical protein